MEFFATAQLTTNALLLQRHLRADNLPLWCRAIDKTLASRGEQSDIYCLWGEFRVHREVINEGVRFTLPGCPNGVQWTVTVSREQPGVVTIHCTITRPTHDPDFIESLEGFVEAWREGLERELPRQLQAARQRPEGSCPPWYG